MADRVWRFLHAPHVVGWFIPRLPQRAGRKAGDDPRRYYGWLQKTNYRSSRGPLQHGRRRHPRRHPDLPDDLRGDLRGRSRSTASAASPCSRSRHLEPGMAERVAERRADNDATIDEFVFAARYRYESYGYALDNLLVETPHEKRDRGRCAAERRCRAFVAKAERGDSAAAMPSTAGARSCAKLMLPQTSVASAASKRARIAGCGGARRTTAKTSSLGASTISRPSAISSCCSASSRVCVGLKRPRSRLGRGRRGWWSSRSRCRCGCRPRPTRRLAAGRR